MISRRDIAFLALAAKLTTPEAARAQIPNAPLLVIANAIEIASDCAKHFVDNVDSIIAKGTKIWDDASARQTRSRLIVMSAQLAQLAIKNEQTILSLVDYRDSWVRDFPDGNKAKRSWIGTKYQQSWTYLTSRVCDILETMDSILKEVEQERSEFVTTDAYPKFLQLLYGPAPILSSIKDIAPPFNVIEINNLGSIIEKYDRLYENHRSVLKSVNDYIRLTKK